MHSTWVRLQHGCVGVTAIAVLLAIASAAGYRLGAVPDPRWAWPLQLLLLLLGVGGGLAASMRGIEIERQRWQILQEELLTTGEREYAHKNAERQRRRATTIFMLAPVTLGVWFANHLRTEEPSLLIGSLLITPLFGFLIGSFLGRRLEDKEAQTP